MYKVIVDHPELGPESDLLIQGLGTFKNHTETEVTNMQIRLFQNANSVVDSESDNDGHITLKPQRGPHPVDLEIHGVRFEKVDKADDTHESTGEEDN
jgi:hypothetical protein